MSTHAHYKIVDLATMKAEIENIKTHFATKADVIRWTVGVGIATILSILGFIKEFRTEIRQDMQQIQKNMTVLQQNMTTLQQSMTALQQNTVTLTAKVDALAKK